MNESLRDLSVIHYGKSPNDVRVTESDIPIYGTGGVFGSASHSLFDGPLVVVARKGTLGNPSYADCPCWVIDTAYAVIAKRHIDTKWLFYNLSNFDLASLNEATGVPSISRDYLYRVSFPTPSQPEQRKIARILTTLDNLIEKTEVLIAKYQAIKQGMMHDLFTRGVDSSGQLRPTQEQAPDLYKQSELGWIPKEWDDGGIEDYVDDTNGLKPGPFGSSLTKEMYVRSGFRVYGQEQVLAGTLGFGDYFISSLKFSELRGFEVLEHDVLMTLVGVGTVGKVLVVRSPFTQGVINPRLMRIRPDHKKCSVEFLKHLIPAPLVRRQFNQFATGATMPVLNVSVVRSVRLPVVPLEEQKQIASILDSHSRQSSSETASLNKYRKIKSGLMQDLLTGKVRVKIDETGEVAAHA